MLQDVLLHISGREEVQRLKQLAQRLKQLAQQGPSSSTGLGAVTHQQVRGSSCGRGQVALSCSRT
jgi:hypothetical protein